MKICFIRYVLLILVVVFVIGIKAENAFAQNSLNGLVFDTSHKPVARIDVELLDEFERLIKSTQTTSSGLYFFQSLRAGVYYVQIRTGGTNYREAKERIQLGQGNRTNQTTGGTSGGETLQVNFVLETDSRRSDTVASTNNEVVFAQNIPKEAEKSYDDALKALDKKNQAQAITELETAIRIFPTYYLALNRLGYEYIALNKFSEAETVLAKAVEVNPNSFSGKSGLGIAQYKLNKKTEAVKTLGEATVLNPASVNSFLFLGKVYRELKEFEKAEASLKKANELSKNKLPDVHWELALLYYYNLNRYAEAADELELYLKANPKADNKAQVEKLIKTFREKARQKT